MTSIDIKEAKLMRAQLSIQKKMSEKETYSVPVLVGDEVTNVTLKIVRGVEKRGIVDIMLETKLAGKIAATFQAKENGISGMIATDNPQTKKEMEEQTAQFIEVFQNVMREADAGVKVGGEITMNTAFVSDLDLTRFSNHSLNEINETKATNEKAPEGTDAYEIQTARLYRLAESFIRVVKETYK